MNPWQTAQQIRHMLAEARWPAGSQGLVFGDRNVFVYAGATPSDEELPPGFPFALVTYTGSVADSDHPDLLTASYGVVCCVEVAGDPLGEHAVIGSSRADLGDSAGAGVAEVSARVRATLEALTGVDGVQMILSAEGTGTPTTVGRGRAVVFEEMRLTGLCTSAPHYAAPTQLVHTAGTWSWSGSRCTPRWDWMRYRFGYRTGTVPAESPSQLTAVLYTGTASEFAAPATAGRVYSVFADYDERATGSPSASSAAELGSWRAT